MDDGSVVSKNRILILHQGYGYMVSEICGIDRKGAFGVYAPLGSAIRGYCTLFDSNLG